MPVQDKPTPNYAKMFEGILERFCTDPSLELKEANRLAGLLTNYMAAGVDPNKPVTDINSGVICPVDALTHASAMGHQFAPIALKTLMKYKGLELDKSSDALQGLTPLQFAVVHGIKESTSGRLLPIILSGDERSNPLATAHGDDPALHGKTAAQLETNPTIKTMLEKAETLARALQTGSQANSVSNAGGPNLKALNQDRTPGH